LGVIVLIIFGLGVYPQCMLNETTAVSESIFKKFELLLQTLPKH
jgi:NADH:ubiquinone oxidoreductase subunit 4 (subunit M)